MSDIHTVDFDFPAAVREVRKAIEMDPNLALARIYHSNLLASLGSPQEALTEAQIAVKLDPYSVSARRHLAVRLRDIGAYDEAIQQLRTADEMRPNLPPIHRALCSTLNVAARQTEATEECEKATDLEERPESEKAILKNALKAEGMVGYRRAHLQLLLGHAEREYLSPYIIAVDHAWLGHNEEALSWLEKAYAEKDWQLWEVGIHAAFANLRSDPRFQDLLRRLGLRPG